MCVNVWACVDIRRPLVLLGRAWCVQYGLSSAATSLTVCPRTVAFWHLFGRVGVNTRGKTQSVCVRVCVQKGQWYGLGRA